VVRKSFPAEISVNMLSELTGKDRGTVTRRMTGIEPVESKRKGNYYDLKTAITAIFEPLTDEQSPDFDSEDLFYLNPQMEKARLDKARRISVELDNEIKKKNLIPKSHVKDSANKIFGAVRSKILNLPLKASQSMPDKPTRKQLQSHLSTQINEILKDLSTEKFHESI
jgi:phage terminase Nu1 subunit (DNA packaging protein)